MTTFFTMAEKQAVREQGIPFYVSREIPNEETIAAFNEVEEMKNKLSLGKSYTDVDKMMEDLLSWNIPLNQLIYLKNLTDLYIINGNSFLYMI